MQRLCFRGEQDTGNLPVEDQENRGHHNCDNRDHDECGGEDLLAVFRLILQNIKSEKSAVHAEGVEYHGHGDIGKQQAGNSELIRGKHIGVQRQEQKTHGTGDNMSNAVNRRML